MEFLISLILFLFIMLLFFTFRHIRLFLKFKKFKKFLKNYLSLITSARYGNLNLRCEDGFDGFTNKLSQNTNALLESILDRDVMINEYIEREKETQNIKQDFTSSLAHDLKVPIIAQDNTYDLFLENKLGKLNENQKKAIETLKISNNDLKNLVIDLLDVYKLDKTELELNIQKANLNSLIEEAIEQNQSILKIKNKKIIFTKENDIEYNIDAFLFKRVLNNLISNAIFYGKDSQNIYIKLNKNPKNIQIDVIDEGDGIKEEEINKIFKKYYTGAKKYSNIGIGLGLYIANRIILAHNGMISAKNTADKGACFTISLPL